MYLYNVTIIAEDGVREAVKQSIEAQLVGYRGDPTIALLEMMDSPHDGTTYCVQLRVDDVAQIEAFQRGCLSAFQESVGRDYPGKVLFFDSTMKYLNKL